MAESFDIVLSRSLTRDEALSLLAGFVPARLAVHVATDLADVPDGDVAIWALLVDDGRDSNWPVALVTRQRRTPGNAN